MAYLRQKDTGRAITNLQDAIDLDPLAAEPQHLMGQTYDKLDRPQRAVQHYAKALELDPSLSEVYERLGRAYAKLEDAKNAAKYYEEYLRTNPPAAKAKEIQRELQKLAGP
jgi:Tfp pilus assembly protein PilF